MVVDYQARHLAEMAMQEKQQYLAPWVTPDMAKALEDVNGWAFTGLDDDGSVLAVAGVIHQWQGRGLAWAYLSDNVTGPRFLFVHRAVNRFIKGCYLNRIEMTVDCDFDQGHRWATMLGFALEAPRMKGYRPDGGDCALYARVLS